MRKYLLIPIIWMVFCNSGLLASENRSIVQVDIDDLMGSFPDMDIDQRSLLDMIGFDRESGQVDLLVTSNGLDLLNKQNIRWTLLKDSDQIGEEKIDSQYFDYADVTNSLQTYEIQYPSIAKRVDLGVTAENRHIWAMKISDNVNSQEAEPSVLFLGLHQAREIMSTEITMDIISYLLTRYSSDPEVSGWVNQWQIWVIPMVNPDGSAYCWSTDQYWIKNRRDLGNQVFGVDPGHNYPVAWGACYGSSSDPNSNSYRGPQPASEIETQAVINLAQQQRFLAVISYHSFNEMVLTPYGCYGQRVPELDIQSALGHSIASAIQKDNGQTGYDMGTWWELLFSNDGNEGDYLYASIGAMAYSIEVNASSYYPAYSLRTPTCTRNRPGWQAVLNVLESGNVLYGRVLDACTNQPVDAAFRFDQYTYTEQESPRRSEPTTGQYAIVGRPGNLTLNITAPGYMPLTIPIHFNGSPIQRDIELIPTNQPALMIWATVIDDATGDQDGQLDPGEQAILRVAALAPGLSVTGITGTLSENDPYITILDNSASWPDIPAGGAAWTGTNTFRIQSNAVTPEGYAATLTITFATQQQLCNNTDQTAITVQTFMPLCPFWEENLDSDPHWNISAYPTSGSPPGPYHNWEFGSPVVGPPGAYTGLYVYGTDLDDNYDNNWTLALTTPVIDCTDLTEVTLQFARFLQVEANYDHGRVRIRNDGTTWHTVFDSTSSDSAWVLTEVDISEYADNQPNVEIRFDVRADGSVVFPGFYIDDIRLCGNYHGDVDPPPTPTFPPTATPTATPETCQHTGDVNFNGQVTAGDAQTAFAITLGVVIPTYLESCAADCNGNGVVTAGDAQSIFATALGIPSCVDTP